MVNTHKTGRALSSDKYFTPMGLLSLVTGVLLILPEGKIASENGWLGD